MIQIRPSIETDVSAIRDIYNYYVQNTPITFDLEPVDQKNREQWFEQYNQNRRHLLFSAFLGNELIGYASSSQFRTKAAYDGSVETTIYLHPEQTGLGAGKLLYSHLITQLRQTPEVHRCYGVIAMPNDASVSLHSALGFVEAGRLTEVGFKFDQFWDTLWMELKL